MSNKLPSVKKKTSLTSMEIKRIDNLYKRIAKRIDLAHSHIASTVNTEMVQIYWIIGKEIVEEEQGGKKRAQYGDELIKTLSQRLMLQFGKGFSIRSLERMRQFYLVYNKGVNTFTHYINQEVNNKKTSALRPILKEQLKKGAQWQLSWTHYRLLIMVNDLYRRGFYEQEAIKNRWSARELDRQIGSLLYERLAKSKDKRGLMRLAIKGQEIIKPKDAIKDPLVLEFLSIPESPRLVESKLEEALVNNLQQFLLELGKGFAFIARQQRLTLNRNHYYCDLVFYHVILKCYILIDIKTGTLTHNDLGQMQLYVNYYDQECLTKGDNPTIGLILCAEKDDAMVRYTLGDKTKQIFASKYQLYLPSEKELKAEIKRELKSFKHLKLK